MNESEERAAFHGSALNQGYPTPERLYFALRACELYEAEVERLRAEVAARLNDDDYDPAPIIVEYDRVVAERDSYRAVVDAARAWRASLSYVHPNELLAGDVEHSLIAVVDALPRELDR